MAALTGTIGQDLLSLFLLISQRLLLSRQLTSQWLRSAEQLISYWLLLPQLLIWHHRSCSKKLVRWYRSTCSNQGNWQWIGCAVTSFVEIMLQGCSHVCSYSNTVGAVLTWTVDIVGAALFRVHPAYWGSTTRLHTSRRYRLVFCGLKICTPD